MLTNIKETDDVYLILSEGSTSETYPQVSC